MSIEITTGISAPPIGIISNNPSNKDKIVTKIKPHLARIKKETASITKKLRAQESKTSTVRTPSEKVGIASSRFLKKKKISDDDKKRLDKKLEERKEKEIAAKLERSKEIYRAPEKKNNKRRRKRKFENQQTRQARKRRPKDEKRRHSEDCRD